MKIIIKALVIAIALSCSTTTVFASNSGMKFQHYPYINGLCDVCHDSTPVPGGTGNTDPDKTCNMCHSRKDDLPNVHPALQTEKRCVGCHNPHGSNFRGYLKQEKQDLCLGCHSDLQHTGTTVHGPINSEQGCLGCHGPHSTVEKKLLSMKPQALCFSCHDKEIKVERPNSPGTPEPRIVANIKEKVINSPYVHSAVDDNCTSSCHTPHASDYTRLLKSEFPVASHNEYKEKPNTYALCFECHDTSMMARTITKSDTNFRKDEIVNGVLRRKNLHWFHVVDATGLDKSLGRNCLTCHDPHGGNQPFNIRSNLYQMKKNFPIIYTQTSDGGTCTKSCHEPKTYKRIAK
ncbi:cytochrome c3 family protein [Bdellovibrionota bacterium FG-2]